MSVKKVVFGISGLSATSVGIWFWSSGERERRHYDTKMTQFRKTVQKVNELLTNQSAKLQDPEHGFWTWSYNSYRSGGWTDKNVASMPSEARQSKEGMRDFCFKQVEDNVNDLQEGNGVLSSLSSDDFDSGKEFWGYCLDSTQSPKAS
ncbi:hypothetical protein HF1_09800 [Mycoplasma haemofelis str. Langford 1]|uniref:Uncharacterized protein n=1 Tax=Mycoplasma haemofelis (strain Langford 1) TaxID=941640 RepID=E8ZIL7_MYCHL|nr:hypothetical protein [Mycoplasma haemofelis]CBY92988.1 hypothetical protein HF1_09800 [Mycoplasma haemofelis str. Langford 1]